LWKRIFLTLYFLQIQGFVAVMHFVLLFVCFVHASGFWKNAWYYKHWCGEKDGKQPLVWAFDSACEKVFPSRFDRDWKPAAGAFRSAPSGYEPDQPLSLVRVDESTLPKFFGNNLSDVDLCLTLVVRDLSGVPYFKYLSNGRHNVPVQTWSSSKLFGVASAGGRIQRECLVGLDANTTGKHGTTPLGDLITVIPSYDVTAGYSSNANAKYFAAVANHTYLSSLISGPWLGRANESLGGSYGEPIPSDLSFSFNGCRTSPDLPPKIDGDFLSTLSNVELFRRIVLHRDIATIRQFPGITWESVSDILYGAKESRLFPGTQWGGLSAGIEIFVQSGVANMSLVDESGDWRIFSKIGDGISDSGEGQLLLNTYANLMGKEFLLSIRTSQTSHGGDPVFAAQNVLHPIIVKLVAAIMNEHLQ
jgi:hypothetical protein